MTSWAKKYADAMRLGDLGRCIAIEQEHELYGYPPELVSVGLHGFDNGMDPHDAINEYIEHTTIDPTRDNQ